MQMDSKYKNIGLIFVILNVCVEYINVNGQYEDYGGGDYGGDDYGGGGGDYGGDYGDDYGDFGGGGGGPEGGKGGDIKGVVELDFITFDKIVDGTKNVLVRFDDKYNMEEQFQEWQYFAAEMSDRTKLLLAQCSVSEYEESTENLEIFDRYGISLEHLPKFVLFKAGEDVSKPLVYPRANREGYVATSSELNQLLIDENVWLGLEGTLEEFSMLVKDFMKSEQVSKSRGMTVSELRDDIGAKGKEIVKSFESSSEINLKSAKYYMKVMAKIVAQGEDYAQNEYNRIEKLMYDENVKQSLKKWFYIRTNILSQFGAQSAMPQEDPHEGYEDHYDL